MGTSESKSVAASSTMIDPQSDSQSSHVPNHDHDPRASGSDLNDKLALKDGGDETLELGWEFHDKLDLKVEGEEAGEAEKEGSDSEAGGGELKGEEVGETEKKGSDSEAGGGELRREEGGETEKKGSDSQAGGGELRGEEGGEFEKNDLDSEAAGGELRGEEGGETEKKDSDFEAAGGELGGEAQLGGRELGGESGALESGEGQGSDDGWNENVKESAVDNAIDKVIVDYDGWNDDEGYGWNENVKESAVDNVIVDYDGWNDGEGYGWNETVSGDGAVDGVEGDEVEKKEGRRSGRVQSYPLRPDAEDCSFYLKTGNCKFSFNCKFNHPVRRRNPVAKEKVGEREEPAERSGQIECKYYLTSGGCKYGAACKFSHTRVKKPSAAPLLELNFLGLPIRLGERECPYYMRNGSCKFGANCKFNHPDPSSSSGGGGDSPSGYGNDGSISLQGVPSQPSVSSWSSPRALNETAPFVPMMLSPTQAASSQSSDWNGYQAPAYLSERSIQQPSAFVLNNPAIETNVYMHHQKQMPVEEFPERPGEPECSYFVKTGDCKFKYNCKFHHPKNRTARFPPCNLSDKGLPLRPDQNVCTHYSHYGICKFGPACKYDHPPNPLPSSTTPGLDHHSSYINSGGVEVAGMGGSDGANDATIQQPV